MRVFVCVSVLLSLVLAVATEHTASRHRHIGKNMTTEGDTTNRLEKRFDSARLSFYDAGLGSCGKVNTASDFIVALNSAQYDSGSYCFQMITISYGGKTTQAQITDRCPGCPYGGLDCSRGLFDFFSSEDAGIIYATWSFGSGDPAPSPKPTPTPTSTWEASSSTWTPPATSTKASSSVSYPTSSSSAPSSSSSTLPAAVSVVSSSSSPLPSTANATTPSAAVETASNPEGVNNLNQLNLALIRMGEIIVFGSRV